MHCPCGAPRRFPHWWGPRGGTREELGEEDEEEEEDNLLPFARATSEGLALSPAASPDSREAAAPDPTRRNFPADRARLPSGTGLPGSLPWRRPRHRGASSQNGRSLPPPGRPRRGPGCRPRGEPGAGPGGAGPDTHRDDGGALAPLPPVSLSLGSRRCAPAAASAASAAPAASLRPPALPAPGRAAAFSVCVRLAVPAAPGAGEATAPPGKYRSPRAPAPGGPARRTAAARPGAESRPLPAASSRGGFCKSHKMARAPNLRSEKRRAERRRRRLLRQEPEPPAPESPHRQAHSRAHAHSPSHTLALTLTPVPPARRRQRHQQQQQEQQRRRRRRRPHPPLEVSTPRARPGPRSAAATTAVSPGPPAALAAATPASLQWGFLLLFGREAKGFKKKLTNKMATDRPGRYSNCQSKRKTPADVLTSSCRPPAPSRWAGPVARATADSAPSFPSPPPAPTNHPTPLRSREG